MISAALVDDERLWLDLLRTALSTADVSISATFTSPHEALAHWPAVDVAVLDVDLGTSETGFDLARELRARHPKLPIIFLTSVVDPWMIDAAAGSVVAGTSYVLKHTIGDIQELRRAITTTAQGGIVVAPELIQAINGDGPIPGLAPIQIRILRLMAMGRSNAQIAETLGIAQKTVEGNITRTARSLGVPPDENVRVGCVTRYLSVAAQGPHRTISR